MPFGVRSSAVLRFLLCGEHGRTMEYWMSFESGTGSHGAKGVVLHRVNLYVQPPKGWRFCFIISYSSRPGVLWSRRAWRRQSRKRRTGSVFRALRLHRI